MISFLLANPVWLLAILALNIVITLAALWLWRDMVNDRDDGAYNEYNGLLPDGYNQEPQSHGITADAVWFFLVGSVAGVVILLLGIVIVGALWLYGTVAMKASPTQPRPKP